MTQPQRPGGFDMNRLTTGQKVSLGAGILYLISLFFPWLGADLGEFADILGVDVDTSVSGWAGGIGTLSGVMVIALLIWEGLAAAGTNVNLGNTSPALVGAILGAATVVLGIINFIQSLDGLQIGAWIGLIALLALAYGAYVRFQESKVGGSAPPPMA
ncbi:MAG: hypothetical protein ACRDHM_00580 [Actinomycetota bacterium]